jgi:membrane-anchored protein YejM (alkaline phosphatase superfamily)
VTVSGLFSILYGLHPNYTTHIQAVTGLYNTVLNKALKQHRYHSEVYTSSNLTRFSLKDMIFKDVRPEDYHYKHSSEYVKNDQLLVDSLVTSIKKAQGGKPNYWFTFLTSSHHSYYYPKSHEIFEPIATEGTFLLDKFAEPQPFLNDYQNSLHFSDALFGEILTELEHSGLLDSTIIVVTSDHGEAFNDNQSGYWGHGSNFTRYQISVPLILYLPDLKTGSTINKRSGHVDIIPTIMKYGFGCTSPVKDYSSGADLLNLPSGRGLIVESYINKAYLFGDTVYVNSFGMDSYHIDNINQKNEKIDYQKIKKMIEVEGHFIKKE